MMLKLEVRQLRRMVWSIVSNAALRSRERRVSSPLSGSCMVDGIKEVNERGSSRVMFAICRLLMIETRLAGNIGL